MSVDCKIVPFTQAGTGFSVSDLGLTPKVILLFGNNRTADGTSTNSVLCASLVSTIGSTDARFITRYDATGVSPTEVGVEQLDGTAIDYEIFTSNATTFTTKYSFNIEAQAGGFLTAIDTSDSGSRITHAVCLGGSDITNVKTGYSQFGTTTGSISYTGLGFQPDFMIFMTVGRATAEPFLDSGVGSRAYSFGFAAKDLSQGFSGSSTDDNLTNSDTARYQSTSSCLAWFNSAGVTDEMALTSMDIDGFTVNRTTALGSDLYFYWIAVKGVKAHVGSISVPGATGVQSYTGYGLFPGIILGQTVSDTVGAALTSQANHSISAARTSSEQFLVHHSSNDNRNPSVTRNILLTDCFIQTYRLTGGIISTRARAIFSSRDVDGFSLDWTTVTVAIEEILILALGDSPTVWIKGNTLILGGSIL